MSDDKTPWLTVRGTDREPRVGDWYAHCCIQDLDKIETQDDLDSLLGIAREMHVYFWPSLKSALDELEAMDGHTWDEWERAHAAELRALVT